MLQKFEDGRTHFMPFLEHPGHDIFRIIADLLPSGETEIQLLEDNVLLSLVFILSQEREDSSEKNIEHHA